jgi:hypothetical protein
MNRSSASFASVARPPARGASLSESEKPMASSMAFAGAEPRRFAFTRCGKRSTIASQSGFSIVAMQVTIRVRAPLAPWRMGTRSPASGGFTSEASVNSCAAES